MSIGTIASQAFSPNKIPGLSFWLDASDPATLIASGNDLSEWNDKSGNNITFSQITGANKPSTGINTINGKNVINFDGTSDFIAASLSMTAKMIFIVARIEAGFPSIAGLFTKAGFNFESFRMNSLLLEFRGNGTETAGDFTFDGEETRINGVVSTPPAIAIDTAFIISGVSVTASTFVPQLSEDAFSRFWKGDIAEIFAYDTEPSSTDRIRAEQYLTNKWKITLSFPLAFSGDFSEDFS